MTAPYRAPDDRLLKSFIAVYGDMEGRARFAAYKHAVNQLDQRRHQISEDETVMIQPLTRKRRNVNHE
jgi:hypothetical protein